MAEEILTGASPKATEYLLDTQSEFTPASRALEGLTPTQAMMKPAGSPHSIAEIVAHMLFWQTQVLNAIQGKPVKNVSIAAMGWREVTENDWPRVKNEFLAGLAQSLEMARDAELLGQITRTNQTVGFRLLSHAGHDAYHLGQIVLLRRMIGAWPPPGGGDTW
jgi:uncharacterized damage-inducible protein DinB